MKLLNPMLVLLFCSGLHTGHALGEAPHRPYQFQGEYAFQGQVEPIGRLTIDVVDTRRPGAEDRLEQIRGAGGSCVHKAATTIRCSTMKAGPVVPKSSLVAIADQHQNLAISFGVETAEPVLVSRGEALLEWMISQEGTWTGGAFKSYRYLQMPNLVKIVIPTDQGSIEFNTEDGERLHRFATTVVHEDRWRWHKDIANVILE